LEGNRSSENLNPEAEEYPLLEAFTRKRLVKTLQAGKDLASFGKVWRLAVAL
jgi:hypothetical protein